MIDNDDTSAGARPFYALWRAVLLQSIQDTYSRSNKAHDVVAKAQALAWFNGRDFGMVCDMAGYDPHVVRQKVLEMHETIPDYQWRAPNGQGWRTKKRMKEQNNGAR